jgi:site-specific recombinase XerD
MRSGRSLGVRLKGIRRVRDASGVVRWKYHRASGAPLPVGVSEDDPAFLDAYLAAERSGPARPVAGSIRAAWEAMMRGRSWSALSVSYRALLEREGRAILKRGGHVPIRQITADHVERDMRGLSPHAANKRLRAWRALMKHALTEGAIRRDPTDHISRRSAPKSEPHAPWTEDEIAAFRAHWPLGSAEREAFEILHYTGARMSDAVRLGEGMVSKDGWITFRQKKTGDEVSIPFRRALPGFVEAGDRDALEAALRPGHMVWMVTRAGSPRSHKAASAWFAAKAREAGVMKTAHGLRSARAIKLVEGGAIPHQVGAWTGHRSLSEIEHYSRAVNRKKLLTAPSFVQTVDNSCSERKNQV